MYSVDTTCYVEVLRKLRTDQLEPFDVRKYNSSMIDIRLFATDTVTNIFILTHNRQSVTLLPSEAEAGSALHYTIQWIRLIGRFPCRLYTLDEGGEFANSELKVKQRVRINYMERLFFIRR